MEGTWNKAHDQHGNREDEDDDKGKREAGKRTVLRRDRWVLSQLNHVTAVHSLLFAIFFLLFLRSSLVAKAGGAILWTLSETGVEGEKNFTERRITVHSIQPEDISVWLICALVRALCVCARAYQSTRARKEKTAQSIFCCRGARRLDGDRDIIYGPSLSHLSPLDLPCPHGRFSLPFLISLFCCVIMSMSLASSDKRAWARSIRA